MKTTPLNFLDPSLAKPSLLPWPGHLGAIPALPQVSFPLPQPPGAPSTLQGNPLRPDPTRVPLRGGEGVTTPSGRVPHAAKPGVLARGRRYPGAFPRTLSFLPFQGPQGLLGSTITSVHFPSTVTEPSRMARPGQEVSCAPLHVAELEERGQEELMQGAQEVHQSLNKHPSLAVGP